MSLKVIKINDWPWVLKFKCTINDSRSWYCSFILSKIAEGRTSNSNWKALWCRCWFTSKNVRASLGTIIEICQHLVLIISLSIMIGLSPSCPWAILCLLIKISLISYNRSTCIHVFKLSILNVNESTMIVEFDEGIEFIQEVQKFATLYFSWNAQRLTYFDS
jgi:hypothetical protein